MCMYTYRGVYANYWLFFSGRIFFSNRLESESQHIFSFHLLFAIDTICITSLRAYNIPISVYTNLKIEPDQGPIPVQKYETPQMDVNGRLSYG